MDYGQFFSAISQSSAALIGVVTAFLVSKILNEVSEYNSLEKELEDLLIEVEDTKKRSEAIDIDRHDQLLVESDELIGRTIRENKFSGLDADGLITFLGILCPKLIAPENQLNNLKRRKKEVDKFLEENSADRFQKSLHIAPDAIRQLGNSDRIDQIAKEFQDLRNRSVSLISRLKNLKKFISSNVVDLRTLRTILFVLTPVVILLVVYPLSFADSGNNVSVTFEVESFLAFHSSIRGVLLDVLGLFSIALFGYFGFFCHKYIDKHLRLLSLISENILNEKHYNKKF